ncbi:MAG: ATP-binding protein [Cytophagaceae bacterium]
MKLLTKNKLIITYGLSIVNLVVIVLFTLLVTNHRYNKLYYEENVFSLIHNLENLILDLTKSETDVKNYIITSDNSYIQHYQRHKDVLYKKISQIDSLIDDNDQVQFSKIEHLNELIDARLFLLDHAIEIRENGRVEDASYFLESFNDKVYMEKISEIKTDIIQIQKELIRDEKERIEDSLQYREYILLSASMASLIISLIALGTIVRDLRIRMLNEKKLIKINQDKDRFFSIISHDLKGPASNLIALCDIVKNEELSPEEKENLLKMIENASRQNYNLLISLLDWAKMQMGEISFNPKIINLIDLVNENISLYFEVAQTKGIKLLNEVPQKVFVYADMNMVNTVFRNTINNAIKYTSNGGFVKISVSERDKEFVVKIKDSGIGMNKETLDKLFKLGFQRSMKGTNGEEGTGLGLLLCEEFIKKCHGHIRVESEKGKGTTVYFSLPKMEVGQKEKLEPEGNIE